MRFWKSKQFKEQQDQWYRALREDGFDDIETEQGVLKQQASNSYRQAEPSVRENKLLYHLLISEHVQTDKFESDRNKKIMEAVASGDTFVEIAERFKLNRHTVCFICRKYENRWGIKKWKPEQMKSQPKRRLAIAS